MNSKLFYLFVLSISFVPVFSQTLENDGKEKAVAMFFSFFCPGLLCPVKYLNIDPNEFIHVIEKTGVKLYNCVSCQEIQIF